MRPHKLEVTAFGAFPGTVSVDFDELSAGGLFLLHGETGAGKTTLLDAIGFALYGVVPGQRATARRLRCDHTGTTARTEVRLEATLGGRRMRVTRSPEQARPKKRGTGETIEQAAVLLEEWTNGVWTAVSTRAGEADQEIADRLGMSSAQFFQVVLLPQGEFARFLRAGSDDRAKLLERLFSTARFRDVEQWLAERRRESGNEVEALRRRIDTAVQVVAQVAEVEPPEGPGDPAAATVLDPLWAGDLACQADAAAQAAAARADLTRAALAEAQAAAEAARALAERQGRRAAAQAVVAQLSDAEPALAELAATVAAAARAAEVSPVLTEARRAAALVGAAAQAERGARERARRCGAGPDDDADALRAGAREWSVRRGRLADLQATADAVSAEGLAAAEAREIRDELATHLVAAAQAALGLRASRTEAATAREAAREAAEALPLAVSEAARLAEAAEISGRLAEVRATTGRLRERHADARERAQDLRDEAHRLRRDRFDAMVAELASRLEDDAPCPVCGSLDHPDPSEVRADRVTHSQEEAAAEAAEAAREAADVLGRDLAAARALAVDLGTRLRRLCAPRSVAPVSGDPGDPGEPADANGSPTDIISDAESEDAYTGPDPAGLATAAAAAAERVAGLSARAGELAALDEALAVLDAQLAELETTRAAAEEQRVAAARDAAAAAERAAAGRRTLAERLDGAPDLAAALAASAEGADALAAAAVAADGLAQAREHELRCREAALAAALEAGFADAAAAEAAARPGPWRADAAARVAAHRDAVAAATAVLGDPDLAVPLTPPADVAGTAAAAASAAQAHQHAVGFLAEARKRAAQLTDLVPALDALCARLVPLAERAAEVRSLADLAAGQGQNTRRMTLSAFVLAARLEEVAAAASERLIKMSQGRYSLVHTDAGRGNRRVGLGLLARDSWTGHDRDTATLSGGETFLASLALALGLADVVSAEAGGARLEALFVDEGFGSLDADTLDEVMDVIDGLREGGRVVGLVSHVAELRQRIPAQLHVRKTPTGSDVSVVA